MARLTTADKRQIVIEYVAGATCRELAQKFTTSPTTISKILREEKSLQKFTQVEQVYTQERQSLKQKAHSAIMQIIDGLSEDLKKASLRDKINAMESLKDIFGLPEEREEENVEQSQQEELRRALENRTIEGFNDGQDDL